MGKVEKKRKKLIERIDFLQCELTTSLIKKRSDSLEIDVVGFQRRIVELRKQLTEL